MIWCYSKRLLLLTRTFNRNCNFFHKQQLSEDVVRDLMAIVGERNTSCVESVCSQYGKDEGIHRPNPPNVVVKPVNTEQVSHIAKVCNKKKIPMIPYGIGSGLEGGTIAVKGGVCIDLNQMNQVVELNPEDFDVTVEAGLNRKSLNSYLRDTGLQFPVDPGADATIGGMAATSCSGTNSVRYGTMRENVLNLEVVLPNGTVIHTAGNGRRARKTSAGYNLTNLLVGSEGTLGIITKISLRLYAVPEMVVLLSRLKGKILTLKQIMSAVCNFPTVENAVRTAIEILQACIPIARVELLDALSIKACNNYSNLSYKEAPTLFLEFHGTSGNVERETKLAAQIAKANDGEEFIWAKDSEERNRLWNARHNLYYAGLAVQPGFKCYVSDVCVPISHLPKIVTETQKDIASQGLYGHVLGHVGDGNFHSLILFDPDKPEEIPKIKAIVERLVRRAWQVGGTCTGEHGIGLGKMHFLEEEIGKEGYETMRQIKQTFDPFNVMNPGKVINL